jgi:retron-type reverse transcriptase
MGIKVYKHNISSTFQGSILSPLLVNIFLHQLDCFIVEMKATFDKNKKSQVITESNKFKDLECKQRISYHTAETTYIVKSCNTLNYRQFNDEKYKKLVYVRYIDE